MDIILLGITIVSLGVALVMSVTAWRLMRDDKKRSAARVAALSVAAASQEPLTAFPREAELTPLPKPAPKAPWSAPPSTPRPSPFATNASLRVPAPAAQAAAASVPAAELPLNQPSRIEPVRASEPIVTHATGFLGAAEVERDNGGRQKSLAFAAVFLFVVLSGGLVWMMSGPRRHDTGRGGSELAPRARVAHACAAEREARRVGTGPQSRRRASRSSSCRRWCSCSIAWARS